MLPSDWQEAGSPPLRMHAIVPRGANRGTELAAAVELVDGAAVKGPGACSGWGGFEDMCGIVITESAAVAELALSCVLEEAAGPLTRDRTGGVSMSLFGPSC